MYALASQDFVRVPQRRILSEGEIAVECKLTSQAQNFHKYTRFLLHYNWVEGIVKNKGHNLDEFERKTLPLCTQSPQSAACIASTTPTSSIMTLRRDKFTRTGLYNFTCFFAVTTMNDDSYVRDADVVVVDVVNPTAPTRFLTKNETSVFTLADLRFAWNDDRRGVSAACGVQYGSAAAAAAAGDDALSWHVIANDSNYQVPIRDACNGTIDYSRSFQSSACLWRDADAVWKVLFVPEASLTPNEETAFACKLNLTGHVGIVIRTVLLKVEQ